MNNFNLYVWCGDGILDAYKSRTGVAVAFAADVTAAWRILREKDFRAYCFLQGIQEDYQFLFEVPEQEAFLSNHPLTLTGGIQPLEIREPYALAVWGGI